MNEKVIDETVELTLVEQEEVLDWKQAKSYRQLVKIAKQLGYKTSWAAFKAKELHLRDTPRWVKTYNKGAN